MSTFKPVVLKGKIHINKKGESNIKILIVHNGQSIYLKTKYYIEPTYMLKSGKVKSKHPNADYLNAELSRKVSNYERQILKLGDTISYMNISQIKEYLTPKDQTNTDFFEYAREHIEGLKKEGKKTWETYQDSIKQIEHYVGRTVLAFNDVTPEFLKGFETYSKTHSRSNAKNPKSQGRSINTISVYLRSMRTIYKAAMKDLNKKYSDPIIPYNPFDDFKIKSEKTKKRNVPIETIVAIRDFTPETKHQAVARDMFMLTFYLIGINVIDLFWCRGLKDGRLEYIRAKTVNKNGREYSIKVEPEAMEIIEKYKGEKYLLKFSDFNINERAGVSKLKYKFDGQERERYNRGDWQYADENSFMDMINDNMKEISKKLGLTQDLTTYWARHSWSTIAWNDCDIPESIVSVCLGHDETANQTTQIYIEKRLRVVDEANRKVLDELLKKN